MILVDAGPLVALLDRADQHHARCRETLRTLRSPLVTVWPAVTEAIYLLGFSPPAQQALLERIENDVPRVLPLERNDLPGVRELMQKYADRRMDFADAALVRVAEREGITTVFTVDRADFATYRLFGRRRFRVIP